MMIDFLDLLGIHKWDIEITGSRITDELAYVGLENEADDLAERTMQYLCEREITEDLGNTIIDCMLEAAAGIVEEKLRFRPEMELYCNGADSRFSILDQDVKEALHFASLYDLDYEFVKWLRDEITDPEDFEDAISGKADFVSALRTLYEKDGSLVWSDRDELGLTDDEIVGKEWDCVSNPDDTDKIFFAGPSGKVWESVKDEEVTA